MQRCLEDSPAFIQKKISKLSTIEEYAKAAGYKLEINFVQQDQ